jgi:chitin disaccharide deacetylase
LKVIFNADDYGAHVAISHGILKAMREGVVRSTTVMANLATEPELGELKLVPGTSVGLHANLTKGKPLTQFPPRWLDESGNFGSKLIFSPEGGPALPYEAVRDEFQAQLQRLLDAGLKVSHVDSHHHVHGFATVLAVVEDLAAQYSLAVRPASDWMAQRFAKMGFRRPDVLITGFFGKNSISCARLEELLGAAYSVGAQSVEVMCHPGLSAGLPEGFSSYREEREEELAVLCSGELAAWLRDNEISVVNYAQL